MYRKRQKERRENEAVGKSFDEGGGGGGGRTGRARRGWRKKNKLCVNAKGGRVGMSVFVECPCLLQVRGWGWSISVKTVGER